ncbi:MAG TPA: DUF721 domain-containing protein [Pyrinomonadaceae bacterium]|nr:DUF721 domain-containing protein [Pyrinomonadaceae bacterium]
MDNLITTLPAILAAAGNSKDVAEAACIAAWKHVVGEALSNQTVPVQLENQQLVVVIEDNIWRRQLEPMRAQLIFRLNSMLGRPLVKFIEWRIDPDRLTQARVKREGPRKALADYPIPGELVTAAAGLGDAKLRRAFLGAASSCVRRIEKASRSGMVMSDYE